MSAPDAMMPFVSAPWFQAGQIALMELRPCA
jgi:hypothetical protein